MYNLFYECVNNNMFVACRNKKWPILDFVCLLHLLVLSFEKVCAKRQHFQILHKSQTKLTSPLPNVTFLNPVDKELFSWSRDHTEPETKRKLLVTRTAPDPLSSCSSTRSYVCVYSPGRSGYGKFTVALKFIWSGRRRKMIRNLFLSAAMEHSATTWLRLELIFSYQYNVMIVSFLKLQTNTT